MTQGQLGSTAYGAWQYPSPVLDAVGPLLGHLTDPLQARFVVTPNKVNGRGFLHAGVITTVADVVIGHGLSALAGPDQKYVTVNLSCDFLGIAALDDVVDVVVVPSKVGGRIASGAATFSCRGRIIASAHALFVPV